MKSIERFLNLAYATLKELEGQLPTREAQTAKASMGEGCCTVEVCAPEAASKEDVDYLRQRIDWFREDLDSLRAELYKHSNEGHLPKINGVTALTRAIKALGLEGDYEVKKNVIYANDGSVSSASWTIGPKI